MSELKQTSEKTSEDMKKQIETLKTEKSEESKKLEAEKKKLLET